MQNSDERDFRIKKLATLRSKGINPYPSEGNRTATCKQCLLHFKEWSSEKKEQTVAGRIRSIRLHGGSAFLTIEDNSGTLQLFLRKNTIGEDAFDVVNNNLDIGDFLECRGTLFLTKTGEKTLDGAAVRILCKSLLPLPEKWHGLSDVEMRYRQRYLDLIANPGVKDIFMRRNKIISLIRAFFEEREFLEVETPILQPIPGGATARPFITHHNALDSDLYLRIAPELYLKRLIVGGFERVFEFSRCFRNEGVDHSHNPEFTQIEAYTAYSDYRELMNLIEHMFTKLSAELLTDDALEYEKNIISFKTPFTRLSFQEAILKNSGVDIYAHATLNDLRAEAKDRSLEIDYAASRAKIMDELFKEYVVKRIIHPTFIVDYPIELSPLAKKKKDDQSLTERFQLIIGGIELVNGFSELNDSLDQRERFEEQERHRAAGDQEAHRIDEDFITALEHGMPPTAGFGLGIDRLTALFTNSHSLKEVILFPTLRQKEK